MVKSINKLNIYNLVFYTLNFLLKEKIEELQIINVKIIKYNPLIQDYEI